MAGRRAIFSFKCDCDVSSNIGSCSIGRLEECDKMSPGELKIFAKEQNINSHCIQAHLSFARAQLKRQSGFEALLARNSKTSGRLIADLKDQVEELESEVKASTAKSSPFGLTGGFPTHDTQIKKLRDELSEKRAEIGDLKGKLGEQRALVAQLQQSGSALTEAEIKRLATKLIGQQTVEEDLLARIEARENAILNHYQEVQPAMVADRDRKIADIQAECTRKLANMQEQVDKFTEDNEHLRRNAVDPEKVKKVKEYMRNLQEEVQHLKADNDEKKQRIGKLSDAAIEQGKEIERARKDYGQQSLDQVRQLVSKHEALLRDNDKCKKSSDGMLAKLNARGRELQHAQANIKDLTEQLGSANHQLELYQRQMLRTAPSSEQRPVGQGDSTTITPPQGNGVNFGLQGTGVYDQSMGNQFEAQSAPSPTVFQQQPQYSSMRPLGPQGQYQGFRNGQVVSSNTHLATNIQDAQNQVPGLQSVQPMQSQQIQRRHQAMLPSNVGSIQLQSQPRATAQGAADRQAMARQVQAQRLQQGAEGSISSPSPSVDRFVQNHANGTAQGASKFSPSPQLQAMNNMSPSMALAEHQSMAPPPLPQNGQCTQAAQKRLSDASGASISQSPKASPHAAQMPQVASMTANGRMFKQFHTPNPARGNQSPRMSASPQMTIQQNGHSSENAPRIQSPQPGQVNSGSMQPTTNYSNSAMAVQNGRHVVVNRQNSTANLQTPGAQQSWPHGLPAAAYANTRSAPQNPQNGNRTQTIIDRSQRHVVQRAVQRELQARSQQHSQIQGQQAQNGPQQTQSQVQPPAPNHEFLKYRQQMFDLQQQRNQAQAGGHGFLANGGMPPPVLRSNAPPESHLNPGNISYTGPANGEHSAPAFNPPQLREVQQAPSQPIVAQPGDDMPLLQSSTYDLNQDIDNDYDFFFDPEFNSTMDDFAQSMGISGLNSSNDGDDGFLFATDFGGIPQADLDQYVRNSSKPSTPINGAPNASGLDGSSSSAGNKRPHHSPDDGQRKKMRLQNGDA